jgi:hypothetical protein
MAIFNPCKSPCVVASAESEGADAGNTGAAEGAGEDTGEAGAAAGRAACCETCAGGCCWVAGALWLQPEDTAATRARAAITKVQFFSVMTSSLWPKYLAYFQNARVRISRAAPPYSCYIMNGIYFANLSPQQTSRRYLPTSKPFAGVVIEKLPARSTLELLGKQMILEEAERQLPARRGHKIPIVKIATNNARSTI